MPDILDAPLTEEEKEHLRKRRLDRDRKRYIAVYEEMFSCKPSRKQLDEFCALSPIQRRGLIALADPLDC